MIYCVRNIRNNNTIQTATDISKSPDFNPYELSGENIKEPPTSLGGMLKKLGPGFILSAAIVGSGELIATTTLGAQAGFVTFWVVLVSCFSKVAIQLEFGKHAIYSGEPVMAAFNKLPGPKWGKGNWSIWTWLFIQIFKLLQVGGIIGGVSLTLNIAFPQISVTIWAIVTAIVASLLVFKGYYRFIEKFSLLMIGLFTLFTFTSLYFLQYTPFAITWENIWEGMTFQLPAAAVGVAIAAFGITGVGGDEIMYYNYWCIEKGYASYTGPRDDSEEWIRRAKGWIKVMYLDAVVSMLVYTLVTAAFYLLGAAVLHAEGDVPEGYAMVETLSRIYTTTLGPGAKSVFLVGAVIVLFSTVFSALASWTRIYSDAFGQLGWINFYDPMVRKKSIAWLAWIFPSIWAMLFLFIQSPVLMVLVGGFATSILLMIVVFAAFHFKYKRLPASLKPDVIYDVAFYISAVVIVFVGIYGIFKVI